LWIQNVDHGWKNVVDGVLIQDVTGMIQISGFQAGQSYLIQWWDPYMLDPERQLMRTELITAQADQSITLRVEKLKSDLAVMIQPSQP
jgi:hypothetical protein